LTLPADPGLIRPYFLGAIPGRCETVRRFREI